MPHVLERFELRPTDSGTELTYRGELGTDLWQLGALAATGYRSEQF